MSPYDDEGRWRSAVIPAAGASRAVAVSVGVEWTGKPTRDSSVEAVDLERPERTFPRIPIPRNRDAYPLLVSPDGSRAATVSSAGTWVAELETGMDHELPAPAKGGLTGRPIFVTPSLLRAFAKDGDDISIRELNIDDGLRAAFREVGRFPHGEFDVSTDGTRIIAMRDGHVSAHDGRTGAVQTEIDAPAVTAAASLPTGALVVAWPADGRLWIARAARGEREAPIDAGLAGPADKVRFGTVQPGSDEVHLTLAHADRTVIVDLKMRTARDLPRDVKPVIFERRFGPVVAATTDELRGHLFVNLGATSRLREGMGGRNGTWLRRTPGTLTLTPLWP